MRNCGTCYWKYATYAEECYEKDPDQECIFSPSRWRPAKLRHMPRGTDGRGGA
jgi:hypothetical protein